MTLSRTKTELLERCSSVSIVPVDPEDLDADEMSRVEEILGRVTSRGPEVRPEHVIEEWKRNDAALWLVIDDDNLVQGILVTAMYEFPTGYSVLQLKMVAVDHKFVMTWDAMRSVVDELESVAADFDCDAVRISGRKGWGRLLDGYVEVERTFDKVVRRDG